MKTYTVVFKPEAEDNLDGLYDFIADASSPIVASRYVESIVAYCLGLSDFPYRGPARDDIMPGLRSISYHSRTLIIFNVEEDRVVVQGVFYGGQNWESQFPS